VTKYDERFQEKISWPISVWSLYVALCATISFSVWAALGNVAAIAASIFQFILLVLWSIRNSLSIYNETIDHQHHLYVDGARLPLTLIKEISVLDPLEMSRMRTRDANPRAYLALRFWVKTGVKIELADPADPTPYWLISTKKGRELKEVITRNLYR
jgi:hypothetical protein